MIIYTIQKLEKSHNDLTVAFLCTPDI